MIKKSKIIYTFAEKANVYKYRPEEYIRSYCMIHNLRVTKHSIKYIGVDITIESGLKRSKLLHIILHLTKDN